MRSHRRGTSAGSLCAFLQLMQATAARLSPAGDPLGIGGVVAPSPIVTSEPAIMRGPPREATHGTVPRAPAVTVAPWGPATGA